MKHLFIINPAAGSSDRTEDYRKKISGICDPRGIDYRIAVSAAPGDCCRLAREAAQTGEEYRIYSCGGDGTLNEVVAGVVGYENVSVTMFAGGSGNDFIRIFNETAPFRELERLLDTIEAPKTLREIGVEESLLPIFFMATKDIRDKYVLSRLAWDLGILEELAETLK